MELARQAPRVEPLWSQRRLLLGVVAGVAAVTVLHSLTGVDRKAQSGSACSLDSTGNSSSATPRTALTARRQQTERGAWQ